MTYAPQVELRFGKLINHLAGVAVDGADNVYVLDSYYGQVWETAAGTDNPKPLPFKDLGQALEAAVDTAGNLYVTDGYHRRVLKLVPGTATPPCSQRGGVVCLSQLAAFMSSGDST